MRRLLTYPRTILRAQRGERDDPRLLTYIVTFRCNARCVMCDSWQKPAEDELSLAEIERIFRALPQLDAVRLSGGEPFVRPDLLDIAELSQRYLKPYLLHITSNGFGTRNIVRFCELRNQRLPLHLMISVDGLEEKHNQVRGRTSAYARAMATLEALAPRQRELNLRLAVNQTIVDAECARDYRPLHAQLSRLGVAHHMVLAYDQSATYSLTRNVVVAPREPGDFTLRGQLSEDALRTLLEEALSDAEELPLPERLERRYYLEGARARTLHDRPLRTPPCVALSSHLRMFPNGDVPTCQFNSRIVGNLRKTPFRELWQSESACTQRDWVKACPGCFAECELAPNALYSGDLLRSAADRTWQAATSVAGKTTSA